MHELLTTAEMAEADRLAMAGGVPGIALMQRAGAAVAEAAREFCPPGKAVAVVAGPGNNGGDGFVAARLLADAGYQVRVLEVGDPARRSGDAAVAALRWAGPALPAQPDALAPCDLIIDALFGAGLARPPEGLALAMIEAMNEAAAPVVAVDLPSGINGTTGAALGTAVRAAATVTFFRRKPGHLLMPGRAHCGRIRVADIGIPDTVLERIKPQTVANGPSVWAHQFPVPRSDGHKYSRGHTVVVSGGLDSTGAARLAARGALRAGSGLVTIASPRDALALNAAASLAVMVRPVDGAEELGAFLADRRRNAVVIGPGGGVGAPMRAMVAAALGDQRGVVLDADALTSFADAPKDLLALMAGHSGLILTPHDGEFSRLFGYLYGFPELDSKLERTRGTARASGAVILLKGPDTVIASPDGRAAINDNAPAWLATAGSGDVLAGIAAGLLAQGMPAFEAAAAAVWLHGAAATEFGPGLIAEDLPETLPKVYRRLLADALR
jgi:hydroxyethylthiazole kinase-like uncharacterized protein yjeF